MAKISEKPTAFLVPTNIGKNPDLGLRLGPCLFTGPMAGETKTPIPAGTEDR